MSRSQRARTPENFPRMQYRARKRHARQAAGQVASALPAFAALVSRAMDRVTQLFIDVGEALSKALQPWRTQYDYALAGPVSRG
ncbi:hypothetical protein ACQCSX_04345 [Pseudarthrobacter sp. P1]|uniref:hypothetical protein n=1 Tax=Pseudarthrobacter sp. P1 TaxID=3418418 RepID=UPI003CEA39B2